MSKIDLNALCLHSLTAVTYLLNGERGVSQAVIPIRFRQIIEKLLTQPVPHYDPDFWGIGRTRMRLIDNPPRWEVLSRAVDFGPIRRNEDADQFVAKTGAVIRHDGEQPEYDANQDIIVMPPDGLFFDTPNMTREQAYYRTLFHELIHWTGAAHRLDRLSECFSDPITQRIEEVIAELGAAFLMHEFWQSHEPIPAHAVYIQREMSLLRSHTILPIITRELPLPSR
ncbi:zincin-like metallopeptidase domain-containing protein [Cohaesibacter celericrescens]|uniref:Polyvalent protein metallopeptidase domain-containing protein n=1 Tax=Cohaesibacter celericrescens TaxID=2067669 RepID=A0A2N5XPL5_9HYPH|nr:zincin-like metallopeptidase domain-containing protein [Cohaesibacter celericrescens]PLW76434.1 hypothetical protein C0081_16295 [Cohaesibacter celericrescens]